MMSDSEWIVLRTYLTTDLAELDRAVLEGSGIDVIVQADDAGGMLPGVAALGGTRLQVRREDAARAAELLEDPAEG